MAKKLALGKGIASLLQESTPQSVVNQTYNNKFGNQNEERIEEDERQEYGRGHEKEKVVEIRYEYSPLLVDVGAIKTNPNQPRKIFKEKDLEELAESIKGILN
jgi:ParB family chromosome partitioning protein